MSPTKIRLGVNLDHVATLRAVRGRTTDYPNLLYYVKEVSAAGADQITIHLREDRRHIHDSDLELLAKKCPVLLNLEMAASEEMVAIAIRNKPERVCLVPEKREELTTEGGLNVQGDLARYKTVIGNLAAASISVSMFIEPSLEQVNASAQAGAHAVEFHTGKWVHLKGALKKNEWKKLVAAAERAHSLGLQVHAGHGLDFKTTQEICQLPYLEEVNIGHFIVCDSLRSGIKNTVREMSKLLSRARKNRSVSRGSTRSVSRGSK